MASNLKVVTVTEMKELVRGLMKLPDPPTVMFFGDPGIGKSFGIEQVVAEEGRKAVKISLGRIEPYDIKGIPDVSGTYTQWKLPYFWKEVIEANGKAVVICDEATLAAEDVQGAILDVIWQKEIDGVKLPKGTLFVLLGNMGGEDGTFAKAFSTALTGGRGMIFAVRRPEIDAWIEFQKPVKAIADFIKAYESKVFYVRPKKDAPFEPWSNPRGWSQLDNIVKQMGLDPDKDEDQDKILMYASGFLSPSTVSLFAEFIKDSVINAEKLLELDKTAWSRYEAAKNNPMKRKSALNDVLAILFPVDFEPNKEIREKLLKKIQPFLDKLVETEPVAEIITSFGRGIVEKDVILFESLTCKGEKFSSYYDSLLKEAGAKNKNKSKSK